MKKSLIALSALFFAVTTVAEEANQAASSTETVTAPSAAGVSASVEVRPSVKSEEITEQGQTTETKMPKYFSENTIDLGYQLSPKIYTGVRQSFDSSFYSFSDNGSRLSAKLTDSVVRAKISDIWSDAAIGTSLSYEPRLYLPVAQSKRDAGMVAALRNYVSLSQKVTDSVSITLFEIPILHAYNRSAVLSDGALTANPVLENRVYLLTSVNITDSLTFDFPLMLNSVRFAQSAGASKSGRLEHTLWIYPELSYKLDSTWTVGGAYYSDNLFKYENDENMGLDIGRGLGAGVAQLLVRASL